MSTHAYRERAGFGEAEQRTRAIAHALLRETGRLPSGKEVGQRYAEEGGNAGTAQTIYSKRVRAELLAEMHPEDGPATSAAPSAPEGWLTISASGQLTLPRELMAAMRLDPSGMVMAEVVDGELRLSSLPVTRDRLRAVIRAQDKGSGSAVDELIRGRRAEAERE